MNVPLLTSFLEMLSIHFALNESYRNNSKYYVGKFPYSNIAIFKSLSNTFCSLFLLRFGFFNVFREFERLVQFLIIFVTLLSNTY